MRRSLSFVLALCLLVVMGVAPTAMAAKAEFTEYTGIETYVEGGPIFDGVDLTKPVVQFRSESVYRDVTTDPRMDGLTYVHGRVTTKDVMSGTGIVRGTFETYVDNDDYVGVWRGVWQGKMVGFAPYFKAVAHGTGDLEGLKMMATYTPGPEGTILIEGRILDPGSS